MNKDILTEILYHVQDIKNIFMVNHLIYSICKDNLYWKNKFRTNHLPIKTSFTKIKYWVSYYDNALKVKNHVNQIIEALLIYPSKLLGKNKEKASCVYFNQNMENFINLSCFDDIDIDMEEIYYYFTTIITNYLKDSNTFQPIIGIHYRPYLDNKENDYDYELRFDFIINNIPKQISYDISEETAYQLLFNLLLAGQKPFNWNSKPLNFL